jgi:DNA-binding beta-propeller fold protein YncE
LVAVALAAVGLSLGIADGFTSLIHWGGKGSGAGDLRSPRGVAVSAVPDRFTEILVADTGNNRIERFNIAGHYLGSWSRAAHGGTFNHPTGVATDSDNDVYVADNDHNRVLELNRHGDLLRHWDTWHAGGVVHRLSHPEDVAIDSHGNLYVTDTGNARIVEFGSTGDFVRSWALPHWGSNPPVVKGIAVGGNDVYATVEYEAPGPLGGRANYGFLDKYTPDGRLLSHQATLGGKRLHRPGDVTVDRQGNVYVADAELRAVLKLNAQGHLVDTTNFAFRLAWGVAVDPYDNLYVSDMNRDVIEKFRQP